MPSIDRFVPLVVSASAGSVQSNLPAYGEVAAVHLSFASDIPTSAAVVLRMAGAISEPILSLSAIGATTAAFYYPRRQVHDASGVVLTTPLSADFVVHDNLQLSVTGGSAVANGIIGTVYLRH